MRLAAIFLLTAAGCKQLFGLEPPTVVGATDAAATDTVGDGARAWWNPDWPYRMPLTISNDGRDILPAGYQIGFSRDLAASPCTSNRDDIRIVHGARELTRVIDEVGPPQWVWFRLEAPLGPVSVSTGEYWLYCGNLAPPPAPQDPKQVFELYDDFTTLDTSVWTTMNTVAISAGRLVCGGAATQDSGIVTKNEPFPWKRAVDFAAQASSATNSNWWAGFENGTMDVPPWLLWYTHNPTVVAPTYRGVAADNPWYGTDLSLDTVLHFYSVENYGDESMYRLDDVPYGNHVYAPMQPPPAMLDVRLWDFSDTTTVSYDWVRVRQAVNPTPAATLGAPETY